MSVLVGDLVSDQRLDNLHYTVGHVLLGNRTNVLLIDTRSPTCSNLLKILQLFAHTQWPHQVVSVTRSMYKILIQSGLEGFGSLVIVGCGGCLLINSDIAHALGA
jgi:hypothetical protein